MAEETLRESLEKAYASNDEPPGSSGAAGQGSGGNEPPQGSPSQVSAPGAAGEPPGAQTGETGASGYLADTTRTQQRLEGQQGQGPGLAAGQPKQPDQQGAQGAAEAQGVKAPQSWRPEVREHWGKLPPEVQQEITRRETQVNRALNEAAQYVSHYNKFNEICQPYASMIAMDGGNPLNTFQEYLKTAATLRIGSPTEKASAIAQAVMQFGIDIPALDTALAAKVTGKPMPQSRQQEFKDPRLDGLLNQIQQNQRAREEELRNAQQAEIDSFTADPKNEFFEDLRHDVADILEMYANRGVRCTLQEAYDRACMMHPEVSKIVTARQQAANSQNLVNQNRSVMDAKRRAAVMPPGSPNVGPGETNGNMSLRDTISAAMQHVESRV